MVRVRGHTPRILGTVLTVVGAIALAVGLIALVLGLVMVNDASNNPQVDHSDMGDVLQVVIGGGIVVGSAGLVSLVVGLILRGIGNAVAQRAQRLDSKESDTPSA